MARKETISGPELATRLAGVFRQQGYQGASLAELAEASGLAKAALYHRFPDGKEGMAAVALKAVGSRMHNQVLQTLTREGSAASRLEAMCESLLAFYDGGRTSCVMDVFSISGTPDSIRDQVQRGAEDWITAIARVLIADGFAETEARSRALDAVIRIEGALIVARAMNDPKLFERAVKALPASLLSH